jgi:hypothetical protein
LRRARLERFAGVSDRGKLLVIDRDQLRRIDGFALGLGDHGCHRLPDMHHLVLRERGSERVYQLAAVAAGEWRVEGGIADAGSLDIGLGQDCENARRVGGGGGVDAADAGMRMGRAHE